MNKSEDQIKATATYSVIKESKMDRVILAFEVLFIHPDGKTKKRKLKLMAGRYLLPIENKIYNFEDGIMIYLYNYTNESLDFVAKQYTIIESKDLKSISDSISSSNIANTSSNSVSMKVHCFLEKMYTKNIHKTSKLNKTKRYIPKNCVIYTSVNASQYLEESSASITIKPIDRSRLIENNLDSYRLSVDLSDADQLSDFLSSLIIDQNDISELFQILNDQMKKISDDT